MIWIGIIMTIASIFAIVLLTKEDWEDLVWLPIALLCGGVILIAKGIEEKQPTALDVYRGKTTLEITYMDSVAIDSVVVYKMK